MVVSFLLVIELRLRDSLSKILQLGSDRAWKPALQSLSAFLTMPPAHVTFPKYLCSVHLQLTSFYQLVNVFHWIRIGPRLGKPIIDSAGRGLFRLSFKSVAVNQLQSQICCLGTFRVTVFYPF